MVYVRFWRRFRIFPHTYLNVSKKGLSLSFVSKLIRMTFGKNGVRFTTGIRGTGLSFGEYKKYHKS